MILEIISVICRKFHQLLLNFLFIPLITSLFADLIGNAKESLTIRIINAPEHCIHIGTEDIHELSDEESVPVVLQINNPITFTLRLILDQKIGLGEAFMYGDWDAEPRIHAFLALLIRVKDATRNAHRRSPKQNWYWFSAKKLIKSLVNMTQQFSRLYDSLRHRLNANTLRGSEENIKKHYDLGNEMFQLFLDPSMTYSCALFDPIPKEVLKFDSKLLEKAQMRKIDKIIEHLQLRASDRVLEIGCGWGACSIRAVQTTRCQWTGLTISDEQFKIAQERVKNNYLDAKINIKLLDYRLEKGIYNKIVAIEMIEAVGHEYLPQFFNVLSDRLTPGGTICIQAICCPDEYYERYRRSSDFIKKHIFPGGHLPSERAIRNALPAQLKITSIEHIGKHYAVTLDLWYRAWTANMNGVFRLGYSMQFHRKWQFYFALCATLFKYSHIDAAQIVLQKAL